MQPMRLMKVVVHSAWLSQENQVMNQKKKEFAKRGEPKWVYATDAGVDLLRFTRHGPWAAHPRTARKSPRR